MHSCTVVHNGKINQSLFSVSSARRRRCSSGQLWYPAADVYQTPDGWLVKVELAGVSAEDIEIDIQGNVLYIAGCRKDRSCAVGRFVSPDGDHVQQV